MHFHEKLADHRTGMIGMERGVPFQVTQQLLPDRVVVRMAQGTQACRVQCLGSPVKSAEHQAPNRRRFIERPHYIILIRRRRVPLPGLVERRPTLARPPKKPNARWVLPRVKVEVVDPTKGADERLRHPSFKGLRDDLTKA